TLATILLERVADGLSILAIVAVLVVALPEARPLVAGVRVLAVIAGAGALVAGLLLLATHRTAVAASRIGAIVRSIVARLVDGLDAIRTPGRFVVVATLTIVPFGVGSMTLLLVAGALGIDLTIPQGLLLVGALAVPSVLLS